MRLMCSRNTSIIETVAERIPLGLILPALASSTTNLNHATSTSILLRRLVEAKAELQSGSETENEMMTAARVDMQAGMSAGYQLQSMSLASMLHTIERKIV